MSSQVVNHSHAMCSHNTAPRDGQGVERRRASCVHQEQSQQAACMQTLSVPRWQASRVRRACQVGGHEDRASEVAQRRWQRRRCFFDFFFLFFSARAHAEEGVAG